MDFVGSKTCSGARGVIVRKLHTKKVNNILTIMLLAADHGEHSIHCMVYKFHFTVSTWMVCTSGVLSRGFVVGGGEVCAELESIIGQQGRWASP